MNTSSYANRCHYICRHVDVTLRTSIITVYEDMRSLSRYSSNSNASISVPLRLIFGLSEPEPIPQSIVIKLPISEPKNVELKKTLKDKNDSATLGSLFKSLANQNMRNIASHTSQKKTVSILSVTNPGRGFRNPYTTVYGCKRSTNGTYPTVFRRITWLRITIVFLRVVYEGIQVVYDRKRFQ